MTEPYVLIVFISETGSTGNVAHVVARGVNSCPGIQARVRTVPTIDAIKSGKIDENQSIAYVTKEDLANCAGLAIGSPTHFGNMASALQYWLEGTTSLWFSGGLVDKPVSVFTSTGSLHGGQETTLMNMLTPLLHQGMLVLGVPYTVESLNKTDRGGTPYGASHVSGGDGGGELTDDEHAIALAQGRRLGEVALCLFNRK